MYLNPGGWSLLVQTIIGALVALPIFMVMFWKQVKSLFKGSKVRGHKEK